MEKVFDVVALGELLIDFTQNGLSGQGNTLFECNPGGAPCNVLALLQKMGKKTAFIGKVGDDMFGRLLQERVANEGVDLTGLVMSKDVNTTLAFVQTFEDGDRDFSFYRNPGADMSLEKDEVNVDLIKKAKIFHFGTLSMTHEGVEQASVKAIETAKEAGCLLSFDPNLREPLWSSLNKAKEKIAYGMSQCDILKISDNEIEFMTGESDIEKGMQILIEKYQPKIAFATLGIAGSIAFYKGMKVYEAGMENPDTIETTGAGDTFMGASLNYILEHGLESLSEDDLHQMLHFANAAASLITTKKGALCVMPTREDVEGYIKKKYSTK